MLAVIAYHASSLLPAGFLGVDMFFVLSGYLITALLLQEHLAHGRVRFGEFWMRRVRRLLPAVFLLLIATAIWTAYSAPVATLEARRSDMISTLLYVANWHFIATDQSYFATFTGVSPLRHMWSLAIEEQFYLVWPLLLAGAFALPSIRRRPARLLPVVVLAIAASAAYMAATYDPANPTRAYFGTDSRAFELLVGCALAMLLQARPALLTGQRSRRLAVRTWPLVVGLLAAALLRFTDEGAFYYRGGALAFALAVAGALWVIEAAPRSLPAQLLSTRPLRWIGTISYGLYLWHWPMIVWIGDPRPGADPWQTQVLEVGLTFAAATLSYYLVESPVRRQRVPWVGRSKRRLVVATLVGFELIWFAATMGTLVTTSNSAVARGLRDLSDTSCPAASTAVPAAGNRRWCEWVRPATAGAPVIATAGDSTSRALDPGMKAAARARGWGYIMAGQGGCSFVALLLPNDTDPAEVARKRDCAEAVQQILSEVAARHPDVWIIADRVLVSAPLILDDGRVLNGGRLRETMITQAIRRVFEKLTVGGAQIVVVGTPPLGQPADCAVDERASGCDRVGYTTSDPQTVTLERTYRNAMAGLSGKVAYISLNDLFCPRDGRCPAILGGVLGRYDQIHYTATFSRRLVPTIIGRARRAGIRFGAAG